MSVNKRKSKYINKAIHVLKHDGLRISLNKKWKQTSSKEFTMAFIYKT